MCVRPLAVTFQSKGKKRNFSHQKHCSTQANECEQTLGVYTLEITHLSTDGFLPEGPVGGPVWVRSTLGQTPSMGLGLSQVELLHIPLRKSMEKAMDSTGPPHLSPH